jgi:hypothetical protein
MAALQAQIAEVGAARRRAGRAFFDDQDRVAALTQEISGKAADETAANNRHVGAVPDHSTLG